MVTGLPDFRRYGGVSVFVSLFISVSLSSCLSPETEPSYIAQSGLEPVTLQTPPLKCWYYNDTRSAPQQKTLLKLISFFYWKHEQISCLSDIKTHCLTQGSLDQVDQSTVLSHHPQ